MIYKKVHWKLQPTQTLYKLSSLTEAIEKSVLSTFLYYQVQDLRSSRVSLLGLFSVTDERRERSMC